VDTTLGVLDQVLALAGAFDSEYVLFGSAVLYLHGVDVGRPPGDVDVFVNRRVWGELLGRTGAAVLTPRAGDPPLLAWDLGDDPPLHVFYEWTARDADWMSVRQCFERAESVGIRFRDRDAVFATYTVGWRCIPLELIRQHKRFAHSHDLGSEEHAKHEADLAILDAHLTATG
jgi:hypothetical protein